jgi:hypothetical protein
VKKIAHDQPPFSCTATCGAAEVPVQNAPCFTPVPAGAKLAWALAKPTGSGDVLKAGSAPPTKSG